MTTNIEETNLNPIKFVTPSSRYANSKVLSLPERGIIFFETYKREDIVATTSDQFMVIPPGDEYRPDKTSARVYGTVDFWWAIMQANQISDIFNYQSGLNIRLPSFITIFGGTNA